MRPRLFFQSNIIIIVLFFELWINVWSVLYHEEIIKYNLAFICRGQSPLCWLCERENRIDSGFIFFTLSAESKFNYWSGLAWNIFPLRPTVYFYPRVCVCWKMMKISSFCVYAEFNFPRRIPSAGWIIWFGAPALIESEQGPVLDTAMAKNHCELRIWCVLPLREKSWQTDQWNQRVGFNLCVYTSEKRSPVATGSRITRPSLVSRNAVQNVYKFFYGIFIAGLWFL